LKYRILYIGYWNLDDPLTHSTIFPNLKILKEIESVESIHFVNTQRESPNSSSKGFLESIGINYKPLFSKNISINLLNKVVDFLYFPKLISEYCSEKSINLIIARGAPAGALAVKAIKNDHIPFIVESYEPHAEYMRYSGTWKVFDPRYLYQKKWEQQIEKTAKHILTVSNNYKKSLEEKGVQADKIEVVPCAVNLNDFYPKPNLKFKYREESNLPLDSVIGVYAGKFGNLYHDEDAFKLFKLTYETIDDFHLLLLTNESDDFINKRLEQFNIPRDNVSKKFVKHSEMPKYLNMCDFAFATIKNIGVSKFQSPVKIGEYWACGLPIMLSKGIGDESDFIEKEQGGVIIENYSTKELSRALLKLESILKEQKSSSHYAKISEKHRDYQLTEKVYKKVLSE